MVGSVMYGCVLALGFFLATKIVPQPAGSVLWWSVLTIQLGIAARLCWRRTGLPFVTAAMAIAAASCALLATLAAAGMVYPHLPATWWPLVGASMVASPSLALVESRVNRAKWDRWRVSSQRCSLWDILRGGTFRTSARRGPGGSSLERHVCSTPRVRRDIAAVDRGDQALASKATDQAGQTGVSESSHDDEEL